MFLNDLSDSKNSNELPLRVYAEDSGYGFNTTPTGYYRYLSEIENLDLVDEKFTNSIWYAFLAFSNLFLLNLLFVFLLLVLLFL